MWIESSQYQRQGRGSHLPNQEAMYSCVYQQPDLVTQPVLVSLKSQLTVLQASALEEGLRQLFSQFQALEFGCQLKADPKKTLFQSAAGYWSWYNCMPWSQKGRGTSTLFLTDPHILSIFHFTSEKKKKKDF